MPHDIDVNRIVRLLKKESIVSRVDILLVDEIEKRGENYPHHFHHPDGKVEQSNLSGKPVKDLAIIFVSLSQLITNGQ